MINISRTRGDYNKFLTQSMFSLLVFISIYITSCTPKEIHGPGEIKPDHPKIQDQEPSKVVYRGKYTMSIQQGILINCNGDGVTIELYDDMKTLEMKGFTNCGLFTGKQDVAKFMKKESYKDMEDLNKDLKYKGIILRTQNPKKNNGKVPENTAYFTPPKPNLVNPLAREDFLKPYVGKPLTDNTNVIVNTGSANISDNGDISVTIHTLNGHADTHAAPQKEDKGRIIEFSVDAPGFSNIPQKGGYMLFNHMKYWIGSNPVAVYKFEIKTKLKDIMTKEELLQQVAQATDSPFFKGLQKDGVFNNLFKQLSSSVSNALSSLFPILGSFLNMASQLSLDVIDKLLTEDRIKQMATEALNKDITIEATLNEYTPL